MIAILSPPSTLHRKLSTVSSILSGSVREPFVSITPTSHIDFLETVLISKAGRIINIFHHPAEADTFIYHHC